jgi:sarcosine oxidase subunit gamma
MSRTDAWLARALPERRVGVKGPRAAEALQQLGLAVPARPNTWLPLRAQDRDDSWNVVGRLGFTEFFIEERGDAVAVAALEAIATRESAGVYPVLREDLAIVLGGEAAADVLAQVCNVNFAALDLSLRPVVMTSMAGVGVLVLPQGSPEGGAIHRIWCDPSFGPYLWETLEKIVEKMQGDPDERH